MGKRGPKPKPRESIIWSSNLAYVIGLIATDGCLYNDGRHINFTSKDLELINTFKSCLGLKNKISTKDSGFNKNNKCYFIQFGNVSFYQFLLDTGLTPAKSKTMSAITVPSEYLPDLIRGLFDGDGSFYYYYDKRWKSSFLFYMTFVSASRRHLDWLQKIIKQLISIDGHGVDLPHSGVYQLKYAKKEAMKLIKTIYYNKDVPCLERKREKIYNALIINGVA